jgi:hypothetical protein
MQRVKEINKVSGTEEQRKELWALHVKADTSGIYELPIDHGISCRCCTKISVESYTHPTTAESKRERRPGRPRLGGRE